MAGQHGSRAADGPRLYSGALSHCRRAMVSWVREWSPGARPSQGRDAGWLSGGAPPLAIAGDRLSGGRSEVRAEASGAVSQGCRKISRTRGLHKEVGPASLEPKWCLRRGRLVSRSGKNNGISAMWKPTTLLRAVWSYPTHRERTARTSSPRWARTVRASERS